MNKLLKFNSPRTLRWSMLLLGAFSLTTTIKAQKIDFDMTGRRSEEVTMNGFTSWQVGQLGYGASATTTVGRACVTVKNSTGGYQLRTSWYKAGINSDKLINDGIHHDGSPQRSTSITVQVSGLSNGTHSLQAYHNNCDGLNGASITVSVNGRKVTTVNPSNRAASTAKAAKSYVTFTGSSATIVYSSNTDFFINSLEFDVADAKALATSPYPSDNDLHANADGGRISLRWTPARNGANSQVLYWGTNKNAVANGTSARINLSGTTTSYTLSGLSPLKTYYWRVDAVKNGTAKGAVWTFQPRRLAFPGAEGYGRYAIGGRGGQVYHVTNLKDDGSYGTFRYGVTKLKGPRTIVFDVAGVITLNSRLTISDPYITIAGQTAPGRGIMFKAHALGVASDGITRFIRMRLGGGDSWSGRGANPNTSDGMGMSGNNNAIMDHCSISWTIDEAFSSRNGKAMTLQHTLISEALNYAGHSHYVEQDNSYVRHGYAATIGGGEGGVAGAGSYHHNLIAHCEGRNWSLSGGLDGNGYYDGHHDVFNNVVYNWGGRTTDGGSHEVNFVNNYYKMGAASRETYLLNADLEGTGKGSQSYYVSGNVRENLNHSKTTNQNELRRYRLSNGQKLTWQVFQNKPFFPSLANIESAEAAYKNVLSDVGCNQPELDNHDSRMVRETLNGTYSTTGHYTHEKGLIDRESDSEGFGQLNITTASRPSNWDTDKDGMPDWWEKAYGTNPNVADNNGDINGDGYTNLEDYLNWCADPHFTMKGKIEVNLSSYFAGYTRPSYRVSYTANGAVAAVSGNKLIVYNGSAKALFSVKVTASQDGVSLTRNFNFYAEGTTGASQPEAAENGTIKWAFDKGTDGQLATVSQDFANHVTTSVVIGNELTYGGVKELPSVNETRIGVTIDNAPAPTDGNEFSFCVTPAAGYALNITKIQFTATRIGTDGGSIDVSWAGKKIASGLCPARNGADPDHTTYIYNVTTAEPGKGHKLTFNFYNIGITKQFGLANVKLYGTLTRLQTRAKAMDSTTGVNEVNAATKQDNAPWYTLTGMKIDKPLHPGIYIHKGKKVMIK
ncbi:MAG: fibronectin type III domain-containing protein [Prevotella sp.]|nr:fibronectin type III domain-containing protein [Prevotella sp.]